MPLSKLVLIQDNFWLKSGKGLVVEEPVLLPLKLFLKKVSLSLSLVSPASCPPHAYLPAPKNLKSILQGINTGTHLRVNPSSIHITLS